MKTVELDTFLENLDLIREKNPRLMFRLKHDIKRGDLIEKSGGLAYEIGDPEEVLSMLGEYQAFPYGPIYKKLESSRGKIWDLFHEEGYKLNGNTVLPFSKAIERGVGECLEKAVLAHLALQKNPDVEDQILVNGILGQDSTLEIGYHAYNLAKKASKWVVIDTENPHAVNRDGTTVPYIVPVKFVNLEGPLCPSLELDPKKRRGRQYSLRM